MVVWGEGGTQPWRERRWRESMQLHGMEEEEGEGGVALSGEEGEWGGGEASM